MFEYIKGTLTQKNPTSIVVDVGGIGYQVLVPISTFSELPEIGKPCQVLIHFVVREDAQILFGFARQEERELFRQLISVSGIGPKMGITILSGKSHADLKRAIVDGSISFLTSISGIGKKTAERIVVELREKIVIQSEKIPTVSSDLIGSSALVDDSLSALLELGYKKQSAQAAIERVLKESEESEISVSDLIRASLQYI